MKIKSDFVTNSSSTSFVVVGYLIDCDDFYKFCKKLKEKLDIKIEVDEEDYYEIIDYLDESMGIYVGYGMEQGAPDDETVIVGEMIAEIDDDKCYGTSVRTLRDFDDIIEIGKKFGKTKDDLKIISGMRLC